MKITTLIESLEIATPYMLRNDGAFLSCGKSHPYLIYYSNESINENIRHSFAMKYLDWFYNNTKRETVKRDMRTFVHAIYEHNDEYKIDDIEEYLKWGEPESTNLNTYDIESLFTELNNETNQEFCRARTSALKYGGVSGDTYFRISSIGFDWFDIMWGLVYKYQNFITSVTVCTDEQSGFKFMYYKLSDGTPIKRLPTEEFITASGRTVIEHLDDKFFKGLSQGKSLIESHLDIHPGHLNAVYDIAKKAYIKDLTEALEMKDEFKEIKPEKFKKYKKGQLGSFQKFNADGGNVGMNIAMFNHASTPQASPNTSPVGGGLGESVEDKDELNRQLNAVIKTFKSKSNEELCKDFDLVDYIPEGPSFVLPSGKIVSLVNYFKYDEPTHTEAVDGMITSVADELNIDIWRVARNTLGEEYPLIDMMFDNIMNGRGWIRLNTGTIDVDERYYFVLPKRRPTNAQFSVVEDFINQGYDDRQREVLVYIEDNQYRPTSKVYSYDDCMPEDIMKSIKRYYASGVLYETVNEKEHLFDEEDVLALEQFIVDMIDYDTEGEFELGDGRYVIFSDKDSQYGGREFSVVDTINHTYFASETTFGKVKPSRVGEIANRLADNLIAHIEQYDNSLIGDSTLKEIKEKCIKHIDNDSDNVIILEKVGGYDTLACEFDKNKNRLHIYSPENPTVDIYRGTLK